ncbi:hypothetical protein DCMF_27915 [Candidatus Formimonas warabiya]|uniref:Sodium:solute symporter family protein n=2 Tax=Formimonas warabiya TaxID=1761012 RepID=A0A3G1L092_FORW1|nr:hypothetical protein DCMF_27915 [Candidatus Formimonas warabiya]
MVGGHRMGYVLTLCAFAATWVSASSMIGGPGFLFRYGYSYLIYSPFAWFVGSAVVLIPIGYKIRRVPLTTIPEFFVKRFNSPALELLMGCIMLIVFTLFAVIQMKGFAIIMANMLGIPYSMGVLFVALMVLYTAILGFRSVALTDVLNFSLLTIGVLVGAFCILKLTGGFTAINEAAALISTAPLAGGAETVKGSLLHPTAMNTFTPFFLFGIFLANGVGGGANPQYAIRAVAAKNNKTAVMMAGFAVLMMFVVYFSSAFVGMGARVLIPTLPVGTDQDWIYPLLAVQYFSPFLGSIIMVGIAAAAISSANAQILLVATAAIYDVYRVATKRTLTGKKLVLATRIAALVAGGIAMIISLNPPELVIVLLAYIYGINASTIFAPLWLGLFWKRATKEGAFAGMVTGGLVYFFWDFFIGQKPIHPVILGLGISVIVMIVVSKLTKPTELKYLLPYFPFLRDTATKEELAEAKGTPFIDGATGEAIGASVPN